MGRRAAGRRQTRGRTGVCRMPRRLGLRETPSPPPAGLRAGAGHVPSVASLLGTIYKVAPKMAAPATQRGGRSGERSGGRGPGIRWTGSREPGDPVAAGRASWRFVAPDCSPQQGNDRETDRRRRLLYPTRFACIVERLTLSQATQATPQASRRLILAVCHRWTRAACKANEDIQQN